MIKIKKTVVGGIKPQICIPVMSGSKENILKETLKVKGMSPDIVEWRADSLIKTENEIDFLYIIKQMRDILEEIPIIFTIRREGYELPPLPDNERYIKYNLEAIESGEIDLVDIELSSGDKAVKRLIQCARTNHVNTILSFHEFMNTPPKEEMIDKLGRMYEHRADICKIAVMSENSTDVLELFEACTEVRRCFPDILPVCISMGEMGKISRVCGGAFGSVLTYAAGVHESAPGQMDAIRIREFIEELY